METQKVQISVRELVEFVYRSGDLDMRFQGKAKMADGIKMHQKIQKSQGHDYQAEVSLQKAILLNVDDEKSIELLVSGRADGILTLDNGYVIDEIKGTSQFVEDIEAETYPVHWAQAKVYGAIYCLDKNLENIQIQLTYAHFESGNIKRIRVDFTAESLIQFLMDTVQLYQKWIVFKSEWQLKRNGDLSAVEFPFDEYRSGQRHLAVSIYNTVKEGGVLYAEAPTGTGKTMSTLFPSVKAMSQGLVDRIFYLSAKTITKVVAEDAVSLLHSKFDRALNFKHITLTAKDKICLNDHVTCYPEKCIYAKGYYDKSLDALWDMINHENAMTKEIILSYSKKYTICPYEFSLDCALFADLIICDYNYAFDPRVYLRRFFEFPTENYIFLVDEAHNLVDRARNMYSAELYKEKFYAVKKKLTGKLGSGDKSISKAIDGVNKMFLEVRKCCDEKGIYIHQNEVSDVYEQLKKRAVVFEKWLSENHQADFYDDVLDLYFDIMGYMRISELYDSGYVFYIVEGDSPKTMIKLFNINPSSQLKRFIDNSRATIFFSATLTPLRYYTILLTGEEKPKALALPSPFDMNRRKLLFATDVSVRFKDRDDAIPKIVSYIHSMARSKHGNYLIFFPSYAYMQQIYDLFEALYGNRYDIIKQKRELSDDEKADFLNEFERYLDKRSRIGSDDETITDDDKRSLIGFAVLGGHFSEGIDLKGDLLIGVMIIGVGLPMISFENDLIKNYFDYEMNGGFEFAYQYPGVNKVMQSAGRVIRGEEDRGVVVLIDQRYQMAYYRRTLPKDWGKSYTKLTTFEKQLEEFWEEYS
jgi:Rad3-related DNA helicase